MELDKILWNIALYLYSMVFAIILIQHHVLYSWPPGTNWIDVPWPVYFFVAFIIMVGYKIANYAADRGEFVEE